MWPLANQVPDHSRAPDGTRMRGELFMSPRKRRAFTPELKAEAVRLTQVGEREYRAGGEGPGWSARSQKEAAAFFAKESK